jgi:hypothetical protein
MKLLPLLLLAACGPGKDDDSVAVVDDACGDVDGPGTDTGNIPNILGYWTSTFGSEFYEDGTCAVGGLTQESETWIGAFEIRGNPDTFYATFGSRPDERFWGGIDAMGGSTMTGQHHHAEGTMYAQFGGLLFHDQYTDRDVVEGAALLGMDVDEDAVIDCTVKGSWKANKSGV